MTKLTKLTKLTKPDIVTSVTLEVSQAMVEAMDICILSIEETGIPIAEITLLDRSGIPAEVGFLITLVSPDEQYPGPIKIENFFEKSWLMRKHTERGVAQWVQDQWWEICASDGENSATVKRLRREIGV